MRLLTVTEVTGLLRMSRDTVYRLAAEGQLPGRKIGRTWRFPSDELERWLRERPPASPQQRSEPTGPGTERVQS